MKLVSCLSLDIILLHDDDDDDDDDVVDADVQNSGVLKASKVTILCVVRTSTVLSFKYI